MAVTNQQVHSLVTYFLNAFKARYNAAPRDFNRFRDKWGFQAMIEDFGMDDAKRIIDFYFSTGRAYHPTNYLLFNYEKLNNAMLEREEDEANRAKLRAESRKRVEEWRKLNEQQ
jgi:hypothetical protein